MVQYLSFIMWTLAYASNHKKVSSRNLNSDSQVPKIISLKKNHKVAINAIQSNFTE